MTIRISHGIVAVDTAYYWQDMASAPTGVKVQLLNKGGVAVYGTVSNNNHQDWLGWAPLPKRKKR